MAETTKMAGQTISGLSMGPIIISASADVRELVLTLTREDSLLYDLHGCTVQLQWSQTELPFLRGPSRTGKLCASDLASVDYLAVRAICLPGNCSMDHR